MTRLVSTLSANLSKLVVVIHLCCLLVMTYSLILASSDVIDVSPFYGVSNAFWVFLGIDVAVISLPLFVPKRKSNVKLVLLLILTLAAFVRLIPNIKYTVVWPFFSDMAVHTAVSTESMRSGHIVEYRGAEHYSEWPVFELVIVSLSIFTGLSPLAIMKFIAGITSAFQILFLYLIVREVFRNEHAALFSALCMAFSEIILVWGSIAVVQPTIAHTLFLMSVFLIIKCLRTRQPRYFVLYVISSVAMTISHPLVGIWFWQIALIAVFLSYVVMRKTIPSVMTLALIPLLLVSLWDFYVAANVSQPMFEGLIRTIREREMVSETLTKVTTRPVSNLLMLFPQSILLLPFALIGGVVFLKMFANAFKRRMYKETFTFAFLTSMGLYLVTGFAVQYYLIGISLFSPIRYLAYAYDVFYVLVGLGIFKAITHSGIANRKSLMTMFLILFVVVSFLGVQAYPSYERGQNNTIVDTYEIASAKWGLTEMHANSMILSDTQIASAFVGIGDRQGYNLTSNPLYLGHRLHGFVEIVIHQNFSGAFSALPEVYSFEAVYVEVSQRMIKWFVGVHAGYPQVEFTSQNVTALTQNANVSSIYSNGEVTIFKIVKSEKTKPP